ALLSPPVPHRSGENVSSGAIAQQLTQQLWLHGVTCRVEHALRGPMVDLFQLTPGAQQRLAPVRKLQEELETQHAGLRLVMRPGSGHLGIEIPLPPASQRVIALREVMQSDAWRRSDAALPLALGLTSVGEPVIVDLAKCPHLLVAGATGAGKSVGINVMLTSLLLARSPHELRLGLIDPKVVELARYRDLPHLLAPPATELEDALALLTWACTEMDRRYELFGELGVTDLASANALTGEHLPRVVIVIDEYADLTITDGEAAESAITRLGQKARAAGIHVILATQRPSVDVVTGIIKANFPARIAYKVAQREDSKTILGGVGAQQLLGRGDSLCLLPPRTEPLRVHSAYVSDDDIRAVCDAWRAQGRPQYVDYAEYLEAQRAPEQDDDDHEVAEPEVDDYDRAIAYAQRRGHVSIRQLESELGCGFKRARELIERMKAEALLEPGGPNNAMRYVASTSCKS
ncbi:MAG TPA: DNA translocase FtsK, partial [Polyangiales bacterium]|nr:DNA translocase FtsK [Polyangiales bacterium]